MSEKEVVRILATARFKTRSDYKANWESINPILLSGEPGVVIDGNETEKIKFGDGITPWNELGWWKGPKGDKGDAGPKGPQGEKGIDYTGDEAFVFADGETIAVKNNSTYTASGTINTLTVKYPATNFICSIYFTLADNGEINITLPQSKYVGSIPVFANGETWELNIKNGIVAGGRVI